MSRMRLIIDQDEVLAEWTKKVLSYYNYDYSANVKREDITDFDISKVVGPRYHAFVKTCFSDPYLYKDLDVVPGSQEGMKSLIDAGHDVIIATATPYEATNAFSAKVYWLEKHFPFFDLKSFVSIKRKYLLRGDVLFDDGAHNIEDWNNFTDSVSVVYDAPWNQKAVATHRVKNWDEFVKYINIISKV